MRLAIFASHLISTGLPFDRALEYGAGLGIEAVEADTGEFAARPPLEYRRMLEAAGMRMLAAHHLCRLASADDNIFSEAVESCERAAEAIAQTGGQYMMLVPSFPQDIPDLSDKARGRERVIEGMNRVLEFTSARGLKLCIENFSKLLYPFSTADELVDMADSVPGLYLTLDAGNIRCLGGNCIDLYDKIKSKLLFCHIKDWRIVAEGGLIATDGKHLLGGMMGYGVVPVGELMFRLKTDGYNGWLVIEQESVGGDRINGYIEQAVGYLKRQLSLARQV